MKNFDILKFNNIFCEEIFRPVVLKKQKKDIYKNTLDLFSAKIDCTINDLQPNDWLKLESIRQVQKTLQNKIGEFHQKVTGCFFGWDDLETGMVIDVVNRDRKIIAEIKNKWNTTKGNHKKSIYDDLESVLTSKYAGYTGYYVEILPKNKKKYNREFTPPDNTTGERRTARSDIREIDGLSWYELVSNDKDFVSLLYEKLIMDAIIFSNGKVEKQYQVPINSQINGDPLFDKFLHKAYQID